MIKGIKEIKGDRVIWIVVIMLCIISLLSVYSSTVSLSMAKKGNTEHFFIRHLMIWIAGFGLLYATHLVRYTFFSRISLIGLIIAIPLLLLTAFHGKETNEASRWLIIPGTSISFQSSDIAKLFLIIYLARLLNKKQELVQDFRKGFLPVILPVVIVTALIFPSNFSTAAILFTTCMVIMFFGRSSLKYMATLGVVGLVGILLAFALNKSYPNLLSRESTWMSRIEHFLDPKKVDKDASLQVDQAKIAIIEGGLLGKGPGRSTQRNYLPSAFSDFIYAIIIEEYGLVGGAVIVLLYLILFYRIIRIASRSPGNFGTLLCIGIGFSIIFQAFINMGVAVNLLPVTGQTLPLISRGGTAIWITCISLGIVLSVSRHSELETRNGTEVDILMEPNLGKPSNPAPAV